MLRNFGEAHGSEWSRDIGSTAFVIAGKGGADRALMEPESIRGLILGNGKEQGRFVEASGRVSDLFRGDLNGASVCFVKFGVSAREVWAKFPEDLGAELKCRVWAAMGLWRGDAIIWFDRAFEGIPDSRAEVLAYTLAKALRKASVAAVFTRIPGEIVPYLGPDLSLEVDSAGAVPRRLRASGSSESMLMGKLAIGAGSPSDYLELSGIHYAPVPEKAKFVFRATYRSEVVAVSVLRSPLYELPQNLIATDPVLLSLDRGVLNVARSVVHPAFRGLDLRMRLIKHAMSELPDILFESRSSLFKGTGALLKHASIIPRPYRDRVPAYRKLTEYCGANGIAFPASRTGAPKPGSEGSPTATAELRELVLGRLGEIDRHQWRYFATLAGMLRPFGARELKRASRIFLESLDMNYAGRPTLELLGLCENWESEAYVYHRHPRPTEEPQT